MYFFVYREANYGNERYRSLLKKMFINGREWYIDPVMMTQVSEFWKVILVGSGSIPPTIDYQDENNTDLIIKGLDILHGIKMENFDFYEMITTLDLLDQWAISVENVINIMFLGITHNSLFSDINYPLNLINNNSAGMVIVLPDLEKAINTIMKPDLTLQEKFSVFFSCNDIIELFGNNIHAKQADLVNELFQNEGINFLWKLSFLPELIKKEYGTDYPTDESIINILSSIPNDVVSTFMIHICNSFNKNFRHYEEYLRNANSRLYPIVRQVRDRDDFNFNAIIYEYQDR